VEQFRQQSRLRHRRLVRERGIGFDGERLDDPSLRHGHGGSSSPRLELAHLPYKKGRTYEEYVGKAGLRRLGKKKWRRTVVDVLRRLKTALEVNDVVIGGGNAKLLRNLPPGFRVGRNVNAFVGGYRLWRANARP
jgi:hypothetical protein